MSGINGGLSCNRSEQPIKSPIKIRHIHNISTAWITLSENLNVDNACKKYLNENNNVVYKRRYDNLEELHQSTIHANNNIDGRIIARITRSVYR